MVAFAIAMGLNSSAILCDSRIELERNNHWKKLLGFQVQMTNGGKVDFGKSFIRNISKIYPLFVLLDWIIGVVTPGVDGRQKYSDRIAGTTVVAIKQAFTATQPPSNSPPAT